MTFPADPDHPRPAIPGNPALTELAHRMAAAITAAELAPPETQPRALVFKAGHLRLALPLPSIREVIVPPEKLSRVPRASEGILGIMNLRGRVVAVVDLRHVLPSAVASQLPTRPTATDENPYARILLLEHGRHEIGLLVQDVEGIGQLPVEGPYEPVLLDPKLLSQAIDALAI